MALTIRPNNTSVFVTSLAVLSLCAGCASQPAAPGHSGPPWAGETFLPNYSELQPVPVRGGGVDYVHRGPNVAAVFGKLTNIMVDQPEIFLSDQSPYKGAKPADLQAIAEFARSTFDAQLTARGYKIVDAKGPGVVYIRPAITDLQLQTKSRGLLAYTPAGFVVDSVVRAVESLMSKMDILDVALQVQFIDPETGEEVAAGVIPRGGGGSKMSFDQFSAVIEEYGARIACRMDNGKVPAAQIIDCSDPAARKARARLL